MDSPRIFPLSGLVDEISQRARLLSLRIEAADQREARALAQLLPQELRLHEALSQPYRAELVCLTTDPALSLRQVLGRTARVTIAGEFATNRLICGLVTGVTRLGADGSLTAYRLRIEPALALLAQRRNARVFQDLSVPQIVQTLLAEHIAGNSAIRTAFQHQANLTRAYPARSYCVQYDEDDLAFITRLLAEEGISYRFEHRQVEEGAAQHVLHLVDHEDAIGADSSTTLRYARDGATNTAQTLTYWQAGAEITGVDSAVVSYDYKLAGVRTADRGARLTQGDLGDQAAASLEDYAALAPYAAPTHAELDRYAQLRQQARELAGKQFLGQGPALGLAPGQGFTLERHPAHASEAPEQREFRVLSQTLVARNNLPAELGASVQTLLARCATGEPPPERDGPARPSLAGGQRYCASVIAVRRAIPIVPTHAGQRHKRTAPGPQTARVVGPESDTVHTDELGRIRIQFHWQRRAGGATGNAQDSTWVRVATANAGAGFGVQFLPRVGDEVLVDFIENDISRPVVVASLYNGHRAPPRFSGQGNLPGNQALSGIQTQEHRGSGYNELLFDDTPASLRARLASTAATSEINLGHLVPPRVNGEARPRGTGIEAHTQGALCARADNGLLLTTERRDSPRADLLERRQAMRLLTAGTDHLRATGEYAQAHGGRAQDSAAAQQVVDAATRWGQADAPPTPLLAAMAERGILQLTAGSIWSCAGQSLATSAQKDIHLAAGQDLLVHSGRAIDLFAQDQGLSAIAHRGDLTLQAQDANLLVDARKNITLRSAEGTITARGKALRLVAEDGSYIEIGNGGITLGSNGPVRVLAAGFDMQGPDSKSVAPPAFNHGPAERRMVLRFPESIAAGAGQPALPAANRPYTLTMRDGRQIKGVTDAQGATDLLERDASQVAQIHLHHR